MQIARFDRMAGDLSLTPQNGESFPAGDLRGRAIKEMENMSIHTYWPILQKWAMI
jgi:hypothetical protein